MTRLLTAALAAAALAAGASAPAASAHADRCGHPHAKTLKLTRLVRVYSPGTGVFACARRTGRRVHLYDDDGIYDVGRIVRIAGYYVAYAWDRTPACKADCPPGVNGSAATEVANVTNGRRRRLAAAGVDALVLTRSGAVAWLAGGELWLWTRGGRRELDSGQIAPRSLRRSHGMLRWTKDGRPQSAPMP